MFYNNEQQQQFVIWTDCGHTYLIHQLVNYLDGLQMMHGTECKYLIQILVCTNTRVQQRIKYLLHIYTEHIPRLSMIKYDVLLYFTHTHIDRLTTYNHLNHHLKHWICASPNEQPTHWWICNFNQRSESHQRSHHLRIFFLRLIRLSSPPLLIVCVIHTVYQRYTGPMNNGKNTCQVCCA